MMCPKCGDSKTSVARVEKIGAIARRIRNCKKCKYVFNTTEKPELIETSKEEVEDYKEYIKEDEEYI